MPAAPAPRAGAVMVTGASSGIGKACTARLLAEGFRVFAGVESPDHARDLDAIRHERLDPVVIDVTDRDSVAQAAATVRAQLDGAPLVGLLNNAGIGVAWPVELVPDDVLRRQFDVNVFGLVAVTQAFLPLLRDGRGRVVNIGSIGGRITMPFAGALCSSKAAVASLTHALRQELRPWGIDVVLVEPASIHTPAVDALEKSVEPNVDRFGPAGRQLYEDTYRTAIASAVRHERGGSPPSVVADVVVEAFTASRPKTDYLAGADSRKLAVLAVLPDRLLDRVRAKVMGIGGRLTSTG